MIVCKSCGKDHTHPLCHPTLDLILCAGIVVVAALYVGMMFYVATLTL